MQVLDTPTRQIWTRSGRVNSSPTTHTFCRICAETQVRILALLEKYLVQHSVSH